MYYAGNKLEIVREYVYLGSPLNQSGTYSEALGFFLKKERKAIQPTLNVINKINIVNLETCKKLFTSLVSSTVLYAASVWSIRYLKDLEKIQNSFFRRALGVPPNTPGYALRKELGLERMQVMVFKLVLNYVIKILKMQDNRYPRMSFNRLRAIDAKGKASSKYNWVAQIREEFFEVIDETEIWSNLNLDTLIREKSNLINKLSEYLNKLDKIDCLISSSLRIYPYIVSIDLKPNYTNLKLPNYFKKVIAQLRFMNKFSSRILTKDCRYLISEEKYCEGCAVQGTFLHYILSCMDFSVQRIKFLPAVEMADRKFEIFLELLSNLSEKEARKIIIFVQIVLDKVYRDDG